IPLNVSRSYLQSDANVKKISGYITKKVADRLEEIFKKEREELENKWDNLKLFIEYGMLSDEKFCDRALKFCLLKNTDGKYFSIEDYKTAVAPVQTDKDNKVVLLYATDVDAQYSFIEAAKNKGYDVLWLDCHLDSYFVNMLEQKLENCTLCRVDADSVDQLIKKEDASKVDLSENELTDMSSLFQAVLPQGNEYYVQAVNMGENAVPVLITQSEFMRRHREMSALGGGMNFYGEMPAFYNINVNVQHPLVAKILSEKAAQVPVLEGEADEAAKNEQKGKVEAYARENALLAQVCDLALLSAGLLKGKALADFLARSQKVVEDAYLK
ncbi:MAG: molecular chaperone HtpG, partial [Bacteroidales bacterium]|nr:molecular chaperone HtpG [Bacteroidales bacterium]